MTSNPAQATGRPIIFSAPMVRALLEGRKSQTRRVLKIRGHRTFSEFGPSDTPGYDWHFRDAGKRWHDLRDAELQSRLSWQVGARLWVREAFRISDCGPDAAKVEWLADHATEWRHGAAPLPRRHGVGLPSIHMPRWASRLTLTVTDVRVQRLQEISEEDAQAEGIYWSDEAEGWTSGRGEDASCDFHASDPVRSFSKLWTGLHGPDAWDKNPWIVALSFTVERRNIDAGAAP